MTYELEDITINIVIERKNIKNTYLKVKDSSTVLITTNYFVTKKTIIDIIRNNQNFIKKAIYRKKREDERNQAFYYLGNKYDVILVPIFENIEIHHGKIYTKDLTSLNKWYRNQSIEIFNERLKYWYDIFEEDIPFPKLKVRNMKTRWGVCNKKDNSITLNLKLIEYGYSEIDYVIIHELSHFVHFNHSTMFWDLVSKYCNNYKEIRKRLKE